MSDPEPQSSTLMAGPFVTPAPEETALEAPESAASSALAPEGTKTYPVTVTGGQGFIDFGILLSCVMSEATVVGHPEARVNVTEVEPGIVRFYLSGLPDGIHDLAVVLDCM